MREGERDNNSIQITSSREGFESESSEEFESKSNEEFESKSNEEFKSKSFSTPPAPPLP